jgi:hypothetical protein
MILSLSLAIAAVTQADPGLGDVIRPAHARIKEAYASTRVEGSVDLLEITRLPRADGKSSEQRAEAKIGLEFVEDRGRSRFAMLPIPRQMSEVGNNVFEDVVIDDGDHSYQVRRRIREKGGTYVLQNVGASPPPDEIQNKKYKHPFVHAPFKIWSVDFTEILDSKGFRLLGTEKIPGNGPNRTKVKFVCSGIGKGKAVMAGWVILAPDSSWRIESYEFTAGTPKKPDISKYSGTIVYQDDISFPPVPATVKYVQTFSSGEFTRDLTFNTAKFDFSSPRRDDFDLAKYGIDDVFTSKTPNSLTYYQIIAIGIGVLAFCASVAVRFGNRGKRLGGGPMASAQVA